MPAHLCETDKPNIKPVKENIKAEVSSPGSGAKTDDHADHKAEATSSDKAAMVHEMGHGAGKDIDGMVRDMRNRFSSPLS